MVRTILKYGVPELVQKSEPVTEFNSELRTLAQDMFETMYHAGGAGLAAPQVGLNIRLFVIDVTGGREQGHQIVLANPEVVEEKGTQKGEEGCLSIPGFTAVVERPAQVRVVGHKVEGERVEMEADGLLARVLCHEVDHLNGVLYLDRIPAIKREWIKRKIRKLIKAGEW